jgi:hypothetical protein
MNDLDAQLDLEADLQAEAGVRRISPKWRFRAKRPPVFRGDDDNWRCRCRGDGLGIAKLRFDTGTGHPR